MALAAINPLAPAMVGGSADLTGSNNTKTKDLQPLTAEFYGGRYIYYGIREFGMAAAMNGMALHGGIMPYGGTFLVFADYMRNAIRLSALQRLRVIYVLTHDSHRPWRGRPDPPAGRASAVAARHSEPGRLSPLRCGRDRRGLGAGALPMKRGPRCSRSVARTCRNCVTTAAENLTAKGAYRLRAAQRDAPGGVPCHRLRSRGRGGGGRAAGGRWHRLRRRLDAVLGSVRRPARGLSPRHPCRRMHCWYPSKRG